jgi:hypothetical protein
LGDARKFHCGKLNLGKHAPDICHYRRRPGRTSIQIRHFAAGWPPRLHPTQRRWHHIQKQLAIMTQPNLSDTIASLARTPGTLSALLRDLPDAWTHRNEGERTWTVGDVVGHLIHGEQTDWMPRARLILEHGESRAFEPFDMMGHIQVCEGKSLDGLLDEFARLRAANLADLRALGLRHADLAQRGRHPALGPVTLSELLATWAAHDLTHLHQLSRVMAHQYREAVGPWAAYLGVMRCAGHSSV